MTIRQSEPEIPMSLPPARLYVDDIEQIIKIFTDALNAVPHGPRDREEDEIITAFRMGTTECDDLKDLVEISDSPAEFGLTVEKGSMYCTFSTDRDSTRWYSSYGFETGQKWSVYHALEQLLRKRKRTFWGGDVLDETIDLFVPLLCGVLVAVIPYLWPAFKHFITRIVVVFGLEAAVIAVLVISFRRVRHHTVIIFQRSWDKKKTRDQFRGQLTIAIIAAAVGAILGIVGTLLVKH